MFRWTTTGGYELLGALPGSNAFQSVAYGVSNDGTKVVGYSQHPSGGTAPVVWTAATGVTEVSSSLLGNYANAISGDGSTIVGSTAGNGENAAFVWDDTTGVTILPAGSPPLVEFTANAVSDDGEVVGGYYLNPFTYDVEGFRWSEANGMEVLTPISANASAVVRGVSGNGAILLGESNSIATIWTDVNSPATVASMLGAGVPANWTMRYVTASSFDGSIITGRGALSGTDQGWLADLGGTDRSFTSPTGGLFADTPNWGSAIVPTSDEFAVFYSAGNYTVSFDQNATNQRATFRNGIVTLDLDGHNYHLARGISSVDVKSAANVTVTDGTLSGRVMMISDDGTGGTVRVEPTGVLDFDIGIRVESGGTLQVNGGEVNAEALNIDEGQFSFNDGVVRVGSGGFLTSTGILSIDGLDGSDADDVGPTLVLQAGHSNLTSVALGTSQSGILRTTSGASLNAGVITIGDAGASPATSARLIVESDSKVETNVLSFGDHPNAEMLLDGGQLAAGNIQYQNGNQNGLNWQSGDLELTGNQVYRINGLEAGILPGTTSLSTDQRLFVRSGSGGQFQVTGGGKFHLSDGAVAAFGSSPAAFEEPGFSPFTDFQTSFSGEYFHIFGWDLETSEVTVSGPSTGLYVSQVLFIGYGDSELLVSDGAEVVAHVASLDSGSSVRIESGARARFDGGILIADSDGSLAVSGTSTNVSAGSANVSGLVSIGDGATLSIAGTLQLQATNNAQLTIDGVNSVVETGALTVADPSQITWNSGTLRVAGSDIRVGSSNGVLPSDLTLAGGKTLEVTGIALDDITIGFRELVTTTVSTGGRLTTGGVALGVSGSVRGDGTLIVEGPDAIVTISEQLTVGKNGLGEAIVRNQGLLNTTGSVIVGEQAVSLGQFEPNPTQTIEVEGAGSRWTHSGNVYLGGTASQLGQQSSLQIGRFNNGIIDGTDGEVDISGTLTVLPTDSTRAHLNGGTLRVGRLSLFNPGDLSWNSGSLQVTNGYLEINAFNVPPNTTGGVYVGAQAIGETLVVDSTKSLSVAGQPMALRVGENGFGRLDVISDGLVDAAGMRVASNGNNGVVFVETSGQLLVNGNLHLGDDGIGELTVRSAGAVDVSGDVEVGRNAAATNSLMVIDGIGSSLTAAGAMTIGGTSAGVGGVSQVDVINGATLDVAGDLRIEDGSGLRLEAATLNMNSLSGEPGSLNFISGNIYIATDAVFDSVSPLANGEVYTLGRGRSIALDGTATLTTSLVINGGSFLADRVIGNHLVSLQGGRYGSTGDLEVGSSSDHTMGIVDLVAGQTLVALGQMTVASDGQLTLFGGATASNDLVVDGLLRVEGNASRLTSDTATNFGEIQLASSTGLFQVNTFSNQGTIVGSGRIGGDVTNEASGEIYAESLERIVFTGASTNNQGLVELLGGTIDVRGTLTNEAVGVIRGRGVLRTQDGLTNSGQLQISGEYTDVFGDVDNAASGSVIVTGGATATFYDDVIHNGSLFRVSSGSSAVFFGDVTGSGTFSGTGTTYFEGTVAPGNSPGKMTFEGDLAFGYGSELVIEITGNAAGEFDILEVLGTATLDGVLTIDFLDGFRPSVGDQFDVLRLGTSQGQFREVRFADDYTVRQSWSGQGLSLTVMSVPEPGTLCLVLISGGLGCFALQRRRI